MFLEETFQIMKKVKKNFFKKDFELKYLSNLIYNQFILPSCYF